MQINLKSNNITNLEFSSKITLNEKLIKSIQKLSRPDSDGDSPFFDSYEGHRSIILVEKANKKTFQSNITFVYQARGKKRLNKKLPRISQLIDTISSINQSITFECAAVFYFPKKFHAKSLIHLPQRYFELPDMPFDKVQGMHFVKLEGSEIKYDVFLESPTSGVLVENVLYKFSSKIDNDLANRILDQAVNISGGFVFKE